MALSDYLAELRTFIRDGRRPSVSGNREQYLDAAAYWQDELKKARQVEDQLRVRILELERTLEPSPGANMQTTQAAATSQRKRKKGLATSAQDTTGRTSKKAKVAEIENDSREKYLQPLLLEHDLDFDEDRGGINTEVNALLQRIYGLQRAFEYTSFSTTTAKDLAYLIIQSTADIRHLISSMPNHSIVNLVPKLRARNTTTRTQEQQTVHTLDQLIADTDIKCTAVARLFPYVLKACASLDELPEANGLQGPAIHRIVSVFRDLLEHICAFSIQQGVQNLATNAGGEKTGKRGKRLLTEASDFLTAPATTTEPEKGDKVIETLCQLAYAMMRALDTAIPAEKALFDGFLFFLITRVGNSLKVFVLGDENPDVAGGSHYTKEKIIHEAQAPYLIYLLKRATSLTAKQSRNDLPPLYRQGSHLEQSSILTKARIQLQNTLLKAVFGAQAEEFAESLKKPLEAEDDCDLELSVMKGEADRSTSEWFKNEVWETVGWDVLHGLIAWN